MQKIVLQKIRVPWKTLLIALLLSGMLPGAAKAATFGNYVYAVPAGWTQAKQGTSLVLTPPGLAAGERVTVLLTAGATPGTVAQGDLNTWFAKQMSGYNAGTKLVTQTPVQAQTSDDGQQLLASDTDAAPLATPTYRLASSTQIFIGPVLGVELGP